MRILLVVAVLLLAACSIEPSYKIEGMIGTEFQGKVYLKKTVGYSYETVDSTIVKNQIFEFTGSVEVPDIYAIALEGIKGSKRFCLENTTYNVSIAEDIKDTEITGGQFQALMSEFVSEMSIIEKNEREIISRYREYYSQGEKGETELDKIKVELNTLREHKKQFAQDYIHNNNGSPHTPHVLNIYIRNFLTIDQLDSVFQTFTADAKASNFGNKIGQSIINTRRSAVGQKLIDFTAPDVSGKNIALSEVVKNNKVVFIDFWASWCGPCRSMIPHLKEIYEEHHSEGLEIIGVSYDDSRKKWIGAIEDEGLNWLNVSNLKGWDCPTAGLYAVRGIPTCVLITSDGIIAGKNLRGDALKEKIKELLAE